MIELELKHDTLSNKKFWRADGENADFICFQCQIPIEIGFICENDKSLILCQNCQDNFDMARKCKHDKFGEHRHIKFQRAEKMSRMAF